MLSFLSQLRWLPFTIPKSTEKKVDFVAVSWTRCFLFYFSVKDSRFADWDFVRCRACTLSVVLETPSLATASASTCTPATPPWLTGVYVFVCKCVPSRNKQMHFHISNGYRILGYALTLISKLSLFFGFFFFLLVPGASTTPMETFWLVRKRVVDVFTVVYHKNNDSSIPSPYSPSDFLFSLFCFPL